MTLPLLRKRYNFHIISFILLSSFFGDVSNATPACPIITNQFQGANGTTVDTGLTGWSIDASALTTPHPTGYYFALKSNRFTATNLGGVGIVNSHVFSIAGYKSPQVSVKITAEGQQNSTEYIQFYYKLDGGAPVLVAQQNGNFGTLTFTSPVLSGNNVQLIIKIYDYNNGSGQNSNYYIERYDVFQTSGPCTPGNASISVSASASNSGAITCSNSSVTLSASSTTTGLSYFWTGPNSYASTSTSPSVSTAGTYTVIVTTSTGWGTATVNVTTNTTAPAGVTATVSGFLSCATAGVTLTGSSTTSGATFTWTGPNSFTATGATATASTAGTYTVTARNPTTGCTATASVAVTSNATAPANLTAISSGSLSCSTTSVTLTGSSSTSGITFAWTGPNGFTATGATASVSIPGTYTVTATNPTTGCTATASTTVVQNITAPAGVTISSSNNSTVLTCSNTFISLTGSSSTPGVSYSWTGPNGFTSNAASTTAFNPGVYTLVVTNPTGGCTSAATITITQNTVAPAGITAINNGPLTCTTPIVTLTGHSSSPGVNYSWTGPNTFTASTDTASVSTAGTYTLTVTDPTNGCTASANTIIAQNTAAPAGLAITSLPATPLLTCTNTNVSLTASSTLSGAGYTWVGPNNFTSSAATITISTPGIYTVTAINTANGCTSSLASSILQNITPPANLSTVSNPLNATLTCSTNSIALTASSAVTGANYSWTGPNSFAGATATATVTSPGTYIVTATDTSNGCSSTASAIIAQNTTAPTGLKSTANPASGQITCIHPNVVLTGSATTTGVNYSWTGPNSYTASGAAATIIAPGVYTVTATDPTNGCTSTATGTVTRNINAPIGVTAGTSDVISCFTPSVFVTGSTTTPGATFSWTGPAGFTASTDNAETDQPGTYILTVTNPANGCITTATTVVEDNTTPPAGVTATNSGPLNCVNTSVTLTGSSTTPGVAYTWVAPDNSLIQGATTSVTVAGAYTLVVTDPDNGCASTATTAVAQNTTGCTGSLAQVRTAMSGAGATLGSDTTQGLAGVTAFEYKTYPNPFSDQAFIEFQSPVSALVTVEIYDNLGVRKKILFNSTVIAHQSYKLELDKGNLSSGTYFCIIRTSNKIYSAKLVLVSR